MPTPSTVRALGIASVAVALLELFVFLRGIPRGAEALLEALPPLGAIVLLYLPGPVLGLVAFSGWANLGSVERRPLRWVPFAAAAVAFAPVLPSLVLLLARLISALPGQ